MPQQITITLRKHSAELTWTGTSDIPAGQLTIRTEDPLEEGTTVREANHAHIRTLARLLEGDGRNVTVVRSSVAVLP